MKKGARGAPSFAVGRSRRLGGDLGLDLLGLAVADAVGDLDLPGLGGLRDLADEVDVKQAVLQARTLHLDIVGELESALESACGNAAVEHLAVFLGGLFL